MITDALFVSITNADFDVESVKNKIKLIREKKNELKETAHRQSIALDDLRLSFLSPVFERIGVLAEDNEDVRSLKELILYGLKGAVAYLKHAERLRFEDAGIYATIEEILAVIGKKTSILTCCSTGF